MGIKEKIKHFLRFKSQTESLESVIQSPRSDLNHDLNHSITDLNHSIRATPDKTLTQRQVGQIEPSSIELQKDSLQLGVAAGYTGRSLKEIESSLNRIESGMISKDWFTSQFEDKTPELIEIMKKHDENVFKRFESIENLLESFEKSVEKVPEPIKTELMQQVDTIKLQLPLTKKMQKLISVVQERGEINYSDLAKELNISEPALRGFLSNTIKRTNKIRRLEKNGKGWVKSTDSTDLNRKLNHLNQ